jgi:hypothetical protein
MTEPVALYRDRSLVIAPGEVVVTGWVEIDRIVLGCRDRVSPGDVKEKWTELLQRGGKAAWPPPVGHWSPDRVWFVVTDGRHEYLAALMHGQETLFVAWVEPLPNV